MAASCVRDSLIRSWRLGSFMAALFVGYSLVRPWLLGSFMAALLFGYSLVRSWRLGSWLGLWRGILAAFTSASHRRPGRQLVKK